MPGYERDQFVNLSDQLAQDLKCSICHDIYKSAVITNCGHSFCRSCLMSYFRQPVGQLRRPLYISCPECRQDINRSVLSIVNRAANAIVDKLRIKCNNARNGCPQVMAVEELAKHLDICRYEVCRDCGLLVIPEEYHHCIGLLKVEINHWKVMFKNAVKGRDLSIQQTFDLDMKCKRYEKSLQDFYDNFVTKDESNESVTQLVAKLLSDTIAVDIANKQRLHSLDTETGTSETTPDNHLVTKRPKKS